ncbi:DUF3152 domain-containing protein [Streptomyces parvulus]|uniref:DUF3152 domain-containing protein n=1 Tax=Streptomyces parvulus TaxID=146923 RepID=UPI0033E8132C
MGRHSRRGPAPKPDAADTAASREGRSGRTPSGAPGGVPRPAPGGQRGGPQAPHGPQGPHGSQGSHGSQGPQGYAGAGRGLDPRFPDGTPAHGFPTLPGGGPGYGGPRLPDGTPSHGFPRLPDGTPARGVPGFSDGTPAQGMPRVRGGHPEQREPGGGWGELNDGAAASDRFARPGAPFPRQRRAPQGGPRQGPQSGPRQDSQGGPHQAPQGGPRQDYLDAFAEDDDVFAARPPRPTPASERPADPYASVTDWSADDGGRPGVRAGTAVDGGDDEPPTGEPAPAKGGRGRAFTGIAAAAVTTVLAVVVAGQVADGADTDGGVASRSASGQARDAHDSASRTDERPTPTVPEAAAPPTYEQKLGKRYPLSPTLKASGKFDAVPGIAKAPGKGEKFTYRVDVEQGLGLDGALFAEAVQKTLNDRRSWAHDGARTFERIHSGQPDFVITLASPGTTADWCAKSGLDTTEDNVSCDSAATERVMINAYRWAQGAEPYGDAMLAYRQMLINHEVGHRLGFNHVTCDKDGELAPVMQQQTKFVDHDGIDCRPNAWAFPNG